jgi:hypothetical protein
MGFTFVNAYNRYYHLSARMKSDVSGFARPGESLEETEVKNPRALFYNLLPDSASKTVILSIGIAA